MCRSTPSGTATGVTGAVAEDSRKRESAFRFRTENGGLSSRMQRKAQGTAIGERAARRLLHLNCAKGAVMTYGTFGAWLMAVALLIATGARGQDGNPGRAAYLRYCSACHGADGKGEGVVSGFMRPKPSDLTALASQNGGVFPAARVREIIDGRSRLAAHGESEMPVWGEVFTEEKAAAQPSAQVRGKLQLITSYLATIQAPTGHK